MRNLLLFLLLLPLFLPARSVHPYHVGSVELRYNSASKTFEITGKFFLDDLENALKQQYGIAVHFNDKNYKTQIDTLLKKYCVQHLKLKINGQQVNVQYLGYEEDSESVQLYLESSATAAPKKVTATISFLYNLFEDQMNIIHVISRGKRQSDRLMYPQRYLSKSF